MHIPAEIRNPILPEVEPLNFRRGIHVELSRLL